MKKPGQIVAYWSIMLALNVSLFAGLAYLFLSVTDQYINKKREVTLLYDINPLRRQTLVPDQQYQKGDVNIHINSLGMRGNLPDMPKPQGMCRIFAIGGSSVFDHKLTQGQSWPERLGGFLAGAGVANVESFNAGVPGYSARESLAFYHDVVRYLDPDVVIFYNGWNDVKYMAPFQDGIDVDSFYYVKNWRDRYGFLLAPRPWRNFLAMRVMLDDYLYDGVHPQEMRGRATGEINATKPSRGSESHRRSANWRATPGMTYWQKNVEAFVLAVLADGAVPVLVAENTLAHPDNGDRELRRIAFHFVGLNHQSLLEVNEGMVDALYKVAVGYNVPMVDLRSKMNGRLHYFQDHVHMFPAGSERFASELASSIAPLFDRDSERCSARALGELTLVLR